MKKIIPILFIALFLTACTPTRQVNNFEECLEAGNPAMESYPRQCREGDQTFTEEIEIVEPAIPENCETWFDGCNNCFVNEGELGGCTRKFCPDEMKKKPKCLKFREGNDEEMVLNKCKEAGGVWSVELNSCFEDPDKMVGPGDPDYRAKEGKMCGGIAGIRCAPDLQCELDGDYPDAGGTCVLTIIENPIIPVGCISWYDGCNNCSVPKEKGELMVCTLMYCETMKEPKCLKFEE